ncbi:TPA: Rha family transcriptional regulator [Shewanella algae]|nr:Rha family transcriptional regulator [Shewanella algae]
MDTSYLDNLNRQQTEYLLPCREIAELTGKTLFNIHRDIKTMFEQLGKDDSDLKHLIERDNRGYIKQYNLPRRECEILVCGYDVVRRAAVIDRWLELETKQRQLPNMTPAQMLAAIAQQQADQEAALLGVKQAQIEQGERLAEIEQHA